MKKNGRFRSEGEGGKTMKTLIRKGLSIVLAIIIGLGLGSNTQALAGPGDAVAGGSPIVLPTPTGGGEQSTIHLLRHADRALWLGHALDLPEVSTLSEWLQTRGFSPNVQQAVVVERRDPSTTVWVVIAFQGTTGEFPSGIAVQFREGAQSADVLAVVNNDGDWEVRTVDAAGRVVPVKLDKKDVAQCLRLVIGGCVILELTFLSGFYCSNFTECLQYCLSPSFAAIWEEVFLILCLAIKALQPVDLSVTMIDAPDPVTVGTNLTYTVTITNNRLNPVFLRDVPVVTLTDTLPGGVTFVSATPTQGSCTEAAGVVTCDLGPLAYGATATVAIVVTPTAPGEITNTVSITLDKRDPDRANNTVTEMTTVQTP